MTTSYPKVPTDPVVKYPHALNPAAQLTVMSSADEAALDAAAPGVISLTNKDAATMVKCEPVYISAAGQVDKARANAAGTTIAVGLVKSTTAAVDAAVDIQTDGLFTATTAQWDAVTGGSGGLTAGSRYYLSAATAGRLTTTAPSTSTQYVQSIGVALSTTVMDVSPGVPVVVP